MKKIVWILLLSFLLSACMKDWSDNKVITIKNDREIINTIETQPELYSQTSRITFSEQKDIDSFTQQLVELEEEIQSNTGALTIDQLVDKATLLDYLWKTGESLQLFEENFELNMNDRSIVFNHNLAYFYDKLWAYDQAINRYEFLISYFNRNDYNKNIANIWKKQWDDEKYEIFMAKYKETKKSK